MGGIFNNPTYARRYTSRQRKYFDAKKTDRKVVKHEQKLQIEFCEYMRRRNPNVHFISDTGSGAFNSAYEKETHNKQQSAPGMPDITVFASRRGWHALLIELKADGAKLRRARNGTTVAVRKDSRGRIIERDYKIRMKGDWYDLHIERQATRHEELKKERYLAVFCVGIAEAKRIYDWYFDIEPEPENATIF